MLQQVKPIPNQLQKFRKPGTMPLSATESLGRKSPWSPFNERPRMPISQAFPNPAITLVGRPSPMPFRMFFWKGLRHSLSRTPFCAQAASCLPQGHLNEDPSSKPFPSLHPNPHGRPPSTARPSGATVAVSSPRALPKHAL